MLNKFTYWFTWVAFVLCAAVTISSGLDNEYDKATFFYLLTLTNGFAIRKYREAM